jgi:hypothetical protein
MPLKSSTARAIRDFGLATALPLNVRLDNCGAVT